MFTIPQSLFLLAFPYYSHSQMLGLLWFYRQFSSILLGFSTNNLGVRKAMETPSDHTFSRRMQRPRLGPRGCFLGDDFGEWLVNDKYSMIFYVKSMDDIYICYVIVYIYAMVIYRFTKFHMISNAIRNVEYTANCK